jgi:phage terminase small subunit
MNPRKPISLKQFEGNKDLNKNAITPNYDGLPIMPKNLGCIAKKWWLANVPLLEKSGVAKQIDTSTLEAAAHFYEIFIRAITELEPIQDFASTQARTLITNSKTAWAEYFRIAQQFGMTAQSRNYIDVGFDADDELAEFLN